MTESGVRIPEKYKSHWDIDRTVMVKFPEPEEEEDTSFALPLKNLTKKLMPCWRGSGLKKRTYNKPTLKNTY
jgi:5-formaminoimidazole-4-carboxamide-1-beta-D-ribofuranosyl 5'-monophosphate synthetase